MARANLQSVNGIRSTVDIALDESSGKPALPQRYSKDGRVYDLKQVHVASGRDPVVATYVESGTPKVVRASR